MPHIAVVIPVFNAEETLVELYSRLKLSLEKITVDFEIILVEDCGSDNSWNVITTLANQDIRIKGLQFSRNFGQHYGITAGLDHCNSDWIVVMDCDLQDQPEEIPRLYQKAQEGYEVVLARRGKRKDPLMKRFFSWLYYKLFCYLADIKYDSQVSNFCIISRKVQNHFCLMRERLRFFGGLISWLGFPQTSIDVQHAERSHGKSTYTFKKLWNLASECIIAYSDKPLRLSIKLGFTISALSFCYGLFIFIRVFLHNTQVLGWSSVIVSIYFTGGIIIATLGMIGIYLGKTFDETKRRPLYIINNTTFKPTD